MKGKDVLFNTKWENLGCWNKQQSVSGKKRLMNVLYIQMWAGVLGLVTAQRLSSGNGKYWCTSSFTHHTLLLRLCLQPSATPSSGGKVSTQIECWRSLRQKLALFPNNGGATFRITCLHVSEAGENPFQHTSPEIRCHMDTCCLDVTSCHPLILLWMNVSQAKTSDNDKSLLCLFRWVCFCLWGPGHEQRERLCPQGETHTVILTCGANWCHIAIINNYVKNEFDL